MLGKLFKYDFIFIQKGIVVHYFLMLIFSVFSRLTGLFEGTIFIILSKIFTGIAISVMVSAVITCILRGWGRFRSNFYKDESYLTHTLPVEKSQLFAAKVFSNIASMFTVFVSVIVTVFAGYYSPEKFSLIVNFIDTAMQTFNLNKYEIIISFVLILFLEMLFLMLLGNFAIVIGQKALQSQIGITIIVGIVGYFAAQTISLLLLLIFGLFNSEFFEIFKTNTINPDIFMTLIWLSAAIYFVYCIVIYLLGNYAFKKGVNVE